MKKSIGFGVVFQASASEVFELIGTAEGMKRWLTNGVELRLRKKGEFRTGDFRVYESSVGRIKEEVIQCDPNRYFSYRIVEGKFLEGVEGHITVTSKGELTRLDWEMEIPEQGVFRTAAVAYGLSAYLYGCLQYCALKKRGKTLVARARAA